MVLNENQIQRLDAKFFAKNALAAEIAIKAGDWTTLDDVSSRIESFGAYALTNEFEYQDDGIPFLRCVNIKSGFVDFGDSLYIDESAHQLLSKSAVEAGMVLLTMSGRVGDCAVASDHWNYPINSNQDVAKLTPKGIDPNFLVAFLSSRVGVAQIERLPIGSIQQHIFLWMIQKILIRRFSQGLEAKIAQMVKAAYAQFTTKEEKLTEAESALIDALGLAVWTPPEPLTYTARAADAFASARLDAQYFMPPKLEMIAALRAMPGEMLGSRFKAVREMFDPARADPDLRVRNFDLPDALEPILDDEKELVACEEVGSLKKTMRNGDVAMSRLRAYLKETAVVRTSDTHPTVGSSEFIVLRPINAKTNRIAPETLMVFLRSAPVQTILKWCQDGSQHPRFSERDLLAIPVPNAVADASEPIKAMVQAAFAARARSHALLAAAKRAVEIAIEDGEPAALTYLAEQTAEGAN